VEGIVNGMAATDDGAITASSIHSYVQKRAKEEGIEPPKYNVKNRNDEFVIKSKVTTIDQTFREVKSTLLSMNDQKLISLDDVTKVLNNCFGSADTPRKLDQDCIKSFYDYHRKRIDFDEFARGQKLKGPKAWVGWILIAAALLFFMYLWSNSAWDG
jgi:hypothetical protein